MFTTHVKMMYTLPLHDENIINSIILHKTPHWKEHTTLATYHSEVRHTTSSAVFLKQSLPLVSCPNVSINVWACTVRLSVIGLTCLLSLLWLSFLAYTVFKI